MKILVIQQKMIGDVLLSTILCKVLKEQYPNTQIDYLINSNTRAVVQGNPYIDNVIEFTPTSKQNYKNLWVLIKKVRKGQYDRIYDAYGKLESNLICLFSGAKKRVSYYKNYTKFCYTQTILRQDKKLTVAGNAIENRLRLLFEESEVANKILRPKIYISTEERQQAKQLLIEKRVDTNHPIIMIGILGSTPEKSLPFATMAQILDAIAAHQPKATLLFNYIPSQREAATEIYELTKAVTQQKIRLDIYGKSLRHFLGLLTQSTMLIGNEGGAVNMAKALDIPTFTVFSPWVNKEVWNMFDDDQKYYSVHLKDFCPEIYEGNGFSHKNLKDKAMSLYLKLEAKDIIPKLEVYLDQF